MLFEYLVEADENEALVLRILAIEFSSIAPVHNGTEEEK
ncbi:hypothetical protein QG37_02790 [Candidozyma auris]|uniref:Uncharacterized protein n=1 Tax=Candidozyma auris TaxID=498019 RepID=A0A0L0P1L2_CANAR|nr:hypothetical protein QG37_02790 [[Candida] auris]